jgi:hypothetical protein
MAVDRVAALELLPAQSTLCSISPLTTPPLFAENQKKSFGNALSLLFGGETPASATQSDGRVSLTDERG